MEIFLPSEQAAAVKIGADARITVDASPTGVGQGYVSFVSPEAQFTPKQVETRSERDKLMFRVKIQVPKEIVSQNIERVKTGIRGVGYVKLDDAAVWPKRLQTPVYPQARRAANEPLGAPLGAPAESASAAADTSAPPSAGAR
jgi:HlyD family secretion protein